MALKISHKENTFGVGDEVKVHLKVKEGEKTRNQTFDGMVIGIKGRDAGKSFTVRKIGAGNIGVEMIFPIDTPSIDNIEVIRHGLEGVKQAKLYFVRDKSPREIEKIYSRASHKNVAPKAPKKKVEKKVTAKKTSKSSKAGSASGRKTSTKKEK